MIATSVCMYLRACVYTDVDCRLHIWIKRFLEIISHFMENTLRRYHLLTISKNTKNIESAFKYVI